MSQKRRFAIGAEVQCDRAHFRVWAPKHKRVSVVMESGSAEGEHPLSVEGEYHSGFVSGASAGDRYRFRIGERLLLPDPASRFQPNGPHDSSQLVDHSTFRWTDSGWKGVALPGQVIYEMHIGTFTREGTWSAAERELFELADLGVTVVEVMPVAEFPGRFGWGYDGVFLFAPTRLYGNPDDFRSFVNTSHSLRVGVILDVVYNHFGPDGNVLTEFSSAYFNERKKNEWGTPLNFDGRDCGPVREFFLENAAYWIDEFHLDGLRLDATQAIHDESEEHILKAMTKRVREAAGKRSAIVTHENESQDSNMIRSVESGGDGIDGAWNDDFHHTAMVAMTGRSEAYYSDHRGHAQEFISSAKYGYLFQGQRYSWHEDRRGVPGFDLEPWKFINFLQNHDQIPNSGRGLRCDRLTSPGRFRAGSALLLLLPGTPLLFQGEEFASSAPFFYFADHKPELAKEVKGGRSEFLKQFRRLDRASLADEIPDPADGSTFESCKLDFRERKTHAEIYRLHKDLLTLRRSDAAFRAQQRGRVDGAVLSEDAFVLRYFVGGRDDRLLLVNFGRDFHLDQAPEPLLAPPKGCGWDILWTSEDRSYGGDGTPPVETVDGWHVMGEAAVVLAPASRANVEGAEKLIAERKRRERTKLGE